MSKIHCIIDNCHYWDQGNNCVASEILVASDSWAAQTPDNVDATAATNIGHIHAGSCMETCCKTFVEKNSNQINVDGITKNSY